MKVPIVGGFYESRTRDINYQSCVNWFPTIDNHGGKEQVVLLPTPGYELFSTPQATGEVRGLFCHNGIGYAVVDSTLYKITVDGTSTTIGSLLTSSGKVHLAANPTQIMVVDNVYGYIYTISTGALAQITDIDFPVGPVYLTFQSGYFIVTSTNGRFYWSTANDGTSWSAFDFATPNYKPDTLRAVISFREDLLMVGDKTLEFYFDDGSTPFSRRTGTSLFMGTASTNSVAAGTDMVAWLARNEYGERVIVALGVGDQGNFQPQMISTDAINDKLNSYATTEDARAYIYQDGGHIFYVISFPGNNQTFVYDFTTKLWHERRSINDSALQPEYVSWRAGSYMNLNGRHIVGDILTGKLYRLKNNVYTENGNSIRRIRRTSPLNSENKQITIHKLDLQVSHGIGIATGQGSDPQIILRTSMDGGRTWGNEMWRSPGKAGEFKNRAVWNILGTSRDWVLEISASDPCEWVIAGGYITGSFGAH